MSAKVIDIRYGEGFDVYIGRGERWGNPFVLGENGNRKQVIEQYRQWLKDELRQGRVTIEDLALLDGKVLGCFCAPRPCHGDVLAKAAKWAAEKMTSEGYTPRIPHGWQQPRSRACIA